MTNIGEKLPRHLGLAAVVLALTMVATICAGGSLAGTGHNSDPNYYSTNDLSAADICAIFLLVFSGLGALVAAAAAILFSAGRDRLLGWLVVIATLTALLAGVVSSLS